MDKMRFTDETAARRHARWLVTAGRMPYARVYPCRVCDGWHITSKAWKRVVAA